MDKEKMKKDLLYEYAVKVGFVVDDKCQIGKLRSKSKDDLIRIIISSKGNYGRVYSLLTEYKAEILLLMRRTELHLKKIKLLEFKLDSKRKNIRNYKNMDIKHNRDIGTLKRAYQSKKMRNNKTGGIKK